MHMKIFPQQGRTRPLRQPEGDRCYAPHQWRHAHQSTSHIFSVSVTYLLSIGTLRYCVIPWLELVLLSRHDFRTPKPHPTSSSPLFSPIWPFLSQTEGNTGPCAPLPGLPLGPHTEATGSPAVSLPPQGSRQRWWKLCIRHRSERRGRAAVASNLHGTPGPQRPALICWPDLVWLQCVGILTQVRATFQSQIQNPVHPLAPTEPSLSTRVAGHTSPLPTRVRAKLLWKRNDL